MERIERMVGSEPWGLPYRPVIKATCHLNKYWGIKSFCRIFITQDLFLHVCSLEQMEIVQTHLQKETQQQHLAHSAGIQLQSTDFEAKGLYNLCQLQRLH